jgi:hypothetical protein
LSHTSNSKRLFWSTFRFLKFLPRCDSWCFWSHFIGQRKSCDHTNLPSGQGPSWKEENQVYLNHPKLLSVFLPPSLSFLYWGLYSGLHTFYAGTVPLERTSIPLFMILFVYYLGLYFSFAEQACVGTLFPHLFF